MSSFNINLFSRANNAKMQSCILIVNPDAGFCIDLINQPIQFSDVRVELGGFDHNQLHFHAMVNGEDLVFYLSDTKQQKALLKSIPSQVQISGLKNHQQEACRQMWIWRSVIGILLVISLSVLLLLINYDKTVSWVANRISIETEQKIGKSVLDSIAVNEAIIKSGASYQLVNRIGAELTKGSKYTYHFYVSANPQVNAFALPGGFVVINAGLMRVIDNPDELAAVIAHEVQHIEQKHTLKGSISNLGIAALVLVVLGDANSVLMLLTHQVATQSYSRGIESEADRLGFHLMRKHGIPTTAMASMLQKLEAAHNATEENPSKLPSHQTLDPNDEKDKEDNAKKEKSSWDIFASHPDTEQRITAVKQLIKAHPCTNCSPLSWDLRAVMQDLLLIKQQREKAKASAM